MVPKYSFLNDCFQQSVQLNKPMVWILEGICYFLPDYLQI